MATILVLLLTISNPVGPFDHWAWDEASSALFYLVYIQTEDQQGNWTLLGVESQPDTWLIRPALNYRLQVIGVGVAGSTGPASDPSAWFPQDPGGSQ